MGQMKTRRNFILHFAEIFEEYNTDTYIVCGDFNFVQDQYLDTYNYVNINHPKAKDYVLAMKKISIWLTLLRYTWRKINL